MKRVDLEDVLIGAGLALLGAGLWLTVGWWALVVLGGLLIGLGVLVGLGRDDRSGG